MRQTHGRHTGIGPRRRAVIATAGALMVAMVGAAGPALGSATTATPTTTTADARVVNGDILVTISGNLYLVKPNGTNLRRLTTGGRIADAEFSPDGTRIAFHKKLADGKPYVFVRTVAGGGLVKLGPGTNPSWSPDGKRLAFINSRGVSVMPVRAGTPSVVLVPNVPGDYGVTYTDVDWA